MTQILWIDDEPKHIAAEIFELKLNYQLETKPFHNPSEALDWFYGHEFEVLSARAIVIDLLMPSMSDGRLTGDRQVQVGQLFCMHLKNNFVKWNEIKPWITLYSRSAPNEAVIQAKHFADQVGIAFSEKHDTSDIAKELIRLNRIRIDHL